MLSSRGGGRVIKVREAGNPAGDRYALKELKRTASNTKVRRFLQEIQVTRDLAAEHSGVIAVVDCWIPGAGETGQPWYVMPLAEQSLEGATVFASDPVKVLDLAIQLADVLEIAHSRKIVHRDIKPANLLMMPGGDVQVADFGICFLADPDSRITGDAASTMGTPDFVAPELLGGGAVESVGPAADVYSLGKTLYAILAGGAVFPRESHRDSQWKLDSRIGVSAAAHIHGLLDRMVARRPEDRFSGMSEAKRHFVRSRAAITAGASFFSGFYGTAESPVGIYTHLRLLLGSPDHPDRRATLAASIDRAISLATAHITGTSNPDLMASRDMQSGDERVAVVAGEFLLGCGAALVRGEADDKAIEWVATMGGLLSVDIHGATRTANVLGDAAAYALLAVGGIAWRHEAFPVLDRATSVYLDRMKRATYLVTQAGVANAWMSTVLPRSEVLVEAEPWVAENAASAIGLVAGVAMLRTLASCSDTELTTFGDNANMFGKFPFGDSPAFREISLAWLGLLAVKCERSAATIRALEAFIFHPQRNGLRGAFARLSPALVRSYANWAMRERRDGQLRFVPGTQDWFRWIEAA